MYENDVTIDNQSEGSHRFFNSGSYLSDLH